jgi:Tfp pilus assembly ATPase PilU
MRDGSTEGMQDFDTEIERLIRNGTIGLESGLAYSTNPGNLRLQLADFKGPAAEDFASAKAPQIVSSYGTKS